MKQVLEIPNISLQEAEAHYRSSSDNYTIEGAENHLTYYRDRHPLYYQTLLNQHSN